MILDNRRLTPTELILLHIQLETEDVRDDDTLRLVSIAVSEVAQAPRREAEKEVAAPMPRDEGRSVGLLAEPLLARVLWDRRLEEV